MTADKAVVFLHQQGWVMVVGGQDREEWMCQWQRGTAVVLGRGTTTGAALVDAARKVLVRR